MTKEKKKRPTLTDRAIEVLVENIDVGHDTKAIAERLGITPHHAYQALYVATKKGRALRVNDLWWPTAGEIARARGSLPPATRLSSFHVNGTPVQGVFLSREAIRALLAEVQATQAKITGELGALVGTLRKLEGTDSNAD